MSRLLYSWKHSFVCSWFRKALPLFLFCCSSFGQLYAQSIPIADSNIIDSNNRLAFKLSKDFRYDESAHLLRQTLTIKENAFSHYVLCYVHVMQNEWDSAIIDGEKAIRLNPNLPDVYPPLYYAYYRAHRWKDARGISSKALYGETRLFISKAMVANNIAYTNSYLSIPLVILFLLILVFFLLRPYYKTTKYTLQYSYNPTLPRFSELLLTGLSVSCLTWIVFYALSGWIWSFNHTQNMNELTRIIQACAYEHDGIESFALYITMFIDVILVSLFVPLFVKARKNKTTYMISSFILLSLCGYYLLNIRFYPPVCAPAFKSVIKTIILPTLFIITSIGLFFFYKKHPLWVNVILVLFMGFAGLIAIAPASPPDLMFVTSPALRLMHGAKFSEIYFQYDCFLSLVALSCFKLHIPLTIFIYLGQVSFFLLLLGSFFFSKGYFKSKGLVVFFIIALILIRVYAVWADEATVLQIMPLRLDLWLIVLLVAYKMGIRHWLVGVSLGLIVIFHRNFGLLYLFAYLELLLVLFLIDISTLFAQKKPNISQIKDLFLKHLRINAPVFILLAASVACCYIVFGEIFSSAAVIYSKIGIGMLPISKISFYWYIPAIITTTALLLYYYKNKLGERYISLGLFIIFLAIANSMYFFGRSHENNMLNISALLILLLFILFDIVIQNATNPASNSVSTPSILSNKNVAYTLPVLFIFLISLYYSDRIYSKVCKQLTFLKKGQVVRPMLNTHVDLPAIRQITHNSKKVYFLDFYHDGFEYLLGNYAPQGYFSPQWAFIYKKDLLAFMQDLLDKHYYIVYDSRYYKLNNDYLPFLGVTKEESKNHMVALSKQDVPYLLPNDAAIVHLALSDTLSDVGIVRPVMHLNNNFSIELLLKPSAIQNQYATIFNNLCKKDSANGMFLGRSGNNPDEYVFAFGNTHQSLSRTIFPLTAGKWHYLVISLKNEFIEVYDNGRSIAANNTAGTAFANSDTLLTIGNGLLWNSKFNGMIRELKINNNSIDTAYITSMNKKVDSMVHSGKLP